MIIATGASGYIGSRAIRRLVELGLPATAMGRYAAPSTLIAQMLSHPQEDFEAFLKRTNR
jgi:nucleoside-diphosphate-sugar epimerase